MFVHGLDLGQLQDYTALATLDVRSTKLAYLRGAQSIKQYVDLYGEDPDEYEGPPISMQLRALERYELGTPYPTVVKLVGGRLASLREFENLLAVDATGVGVAVVDIFEGAGFRPVAVTITGGADVHVNGRNVHVPKRDLVHGLLVALQQGRFAASSRLALAPTAIAELKAFNVKINTQTGHDSYEAWREGDHDDLVLAIAIAAWVAEQEAQARMEQALARLQIAEFDKRTTVQISAY